MVNEKVIYKFKKPYTCDFGRIDEGREVTSFRGVLYIDGIMISEPYATDMRNLLENKDFVKEYIQENKIIKNKV